MVWNIEKRKPSYRQK